MRASGGPLIDVYNQSRVFPSLHRRLLALSALIALALGAGTPAGAGDVTAFAAVHTPRDNWNVGFGAALGTSWFKVLTLEGEACRTPGQSLDQSMTMFTASAMISPPIVGGVTPYGGLGVGLFQQSIAGANDFGRHRALIAGVKVTIQGLIVLKAEVRELSLSGRPPIEANRRFSVGAGIAF